MKKREIRRGNLQQTKQHNKRNITAQWEGSSMVQWQKNNEGGRGRRKIGKEDRKEDRKEDGQSHRRKGTSIKKQQEQKRNSKSKKDNNTKNTEEQN